MIREDSKIDTLFVWQAIAERDGLSIKDQAGKELLQALKDIINAANNDDGYSPKELRDLFIPVLDTGQEVFGELA